MKDAAIWLGLILVALVAGRLGGDTSTVAAGYDSRGSAQHQTSYDHEGGTCAEDDTLCEPGEKAAK